MILDQYFFLAAGGIVAAISLWGAIVYFAMKYKRIGWFVYVVFMLFLCTSALAMCSDVVAYKLRPQSQGQRP